MADAVGICATGYRLGLEELVRHLGVLDERGGPRCMADRGSPEWPGLWFLGHNSSIYGNTNIRRGEARRLARVISLAVQRTRTPFRCPLPVQPNGRRMTSSLEYMMAVAAGLLEGVRRRR